jgi:hypothetical protein
MMYKKLIYLSCFTLMLGLVLTIAAQADLVGWWRLDEGSGTTALDSSGGGNNGTLQGDPQWVAGKVAGALEMDGGDSVSVPGVADINPESITLMTWVNFTTVDPTEMERHDYLSRGDDYAFSLHEWGARDSTPAEQKISGIVTSAGGWSVVNGQTLVEADIWYHTALTYSSETQTLTLYLDGEVDGELNVPQGLEHRLGGPLTIGTYSSRDLLGKIDDIQIWDEALTEAQIKGAIMGGGYPYAYGPDPADGAIHSDTWVTLSWKPGDFAVSHDIYLGDVFEDVDNGVADTFRGNQESTFYVAGFPGFAYPEGLVPGTTYYWRIDEVNEVDPDSPWKGPVWSFSVPPKTAYGPNPADGAESVDVNTQLNWTAGFGAKLHTVYFGDDYDTVANATVGIPAGTPAYNPGPLEPAKVYYWRVDEFDGLATYKGDIWSFTTPGAVGNPRPSYKASEVAMNATLSWTPADSAASHQLYFGTDEAAVRNADAGAPEYKGSKTLGDENYDPGLLEADTTYYWRVDEVDDQGNTAKGPLWIFTTGAFLLVDDFESYTDDDGAGEAIWQTWIDGFGVADNGAQVGYLIPPYAEQTIVHGGSQSMPLLYTNETGVTNSEASMTLALRDWTMVSVETLSLWFRGDSDNAAEPLYVAISNTSGAPAVIAHDDAIAAQTDTWTQWIISLPTFADQGINLTNVDKMAIGLGSIGGAAVGGSGTIYIDDLRLY